MTASFTWMDHAPGDTERVREALRAFDDQGTLDPLGFGVVRDAFSNILFPGITTNQTRAKYFLLVPWAHRQARREKHPPRRALERARELEIQTIHALVQGSRSSETGIIGRRVGAAIGSLPSEAYWSGLHAWGIRSFEGSPRDYLASIGIDEGFPGCPEPPPNVFESTDIRLVREEAEYLVDRVMATHPTSFLAHCVFGSKDPASRQPLWEHAGVGGVSKELARQLHHAELFAVATWGAALILNRVVANLRAEDRGMPGADVLGSDLAIWMDMIRSRRSSFKKWDRTDFWHLVLDATWVPRHTREFIDRWLDLAISNAASAIRPSAEALNLLRAREHQLKGPRARLVSQRAREVSSGLQGTSLLDFRWGTGAVIITDIRQGLR